MRLAENEVLILEGAEDFDVHSQPSVVATQVKHQSGSITLRSPAVKDAIQNFWTHQRNNDEFRVVLRFLTTAVAGCEQGNPFGASIPGLEYWASAAQERAICEPLRQLLLTLSFDEPLLEFVRSATDKELREQLLTRIEWDLGAKDRDALQFLIENQLKVHGAKRGIATHYSVRVLPSLLKEVADLLTVNGQKHLYYGDFLSCFDEATTEVVPRGVLDALQNSGGLQQLVNQRDTGDMARLAAMPPSLGFPLPVVTGAVGRTSLVHSVAAKLKATRVVFLHGSSGVGKTNLASLVTAAIGGSWLWAGFRGRSPEQVQQGLARAAYEVGAMDGAVLTVLDDLDLSRISQFEREFIAFVFAVTQRNGFVLITSISQPPLQIFPKLWLPPDCELLVPYFDEPEISELLSAHGLSDTKQREGWTRVIFLSTSGHPQLVHARARTLSAQSWPPVSLNDLTQSEDIERVRVEARSRLLQDFPSESTRRLAYRLSVIIGVFSRQLALAVGGAPQAIQMAGEAFDQLVGPWIEREGDNRFRVSPLLGGAANQVLTADEIKTVHVAIARNYLSRSTLDQYEVGNAFFHAFVAKDVGVLVSIANKIVLEESNRASLLYDAMSWFPHVALEPGQYIVEDRPHVDLLLRLAQFKLATSTGKTSDAVKIIDQVELLLEPMEESDLKKQSQAMAYSFVLNTFDFHIPSQTVVRLLSRLMDAVTTPGLREFYESTTRSRHPRLPRIAENKPEQLLFSYQAARIGGLDDLEALTVALNGLPRQKRDSLLAVCDSEMEFAFLLVSRAWWKDVHDGTLDVERAVNTLLSVESAARQWGTSRLVLACQVAISVIHDEYGNSSTAALAVLDEADIEFPNTVELVNQRSKVLFHAKREREALAVAEQALALPGLSNVEYVYTCRSAGIAAASVETWEEATKFFELGAARALQSRVQKPMGIGLLADAAIGYWKQDRRKESILKFVEVLDLLEPIPFADNIKLRHLHATVRHCISWIHMVAMNERSEHLVDPLPGMCSNQDPHEGIKDHRIIDISGPWLLLRATERAMGFDCGIAARAEKFSEAKQPLFMAGYQRTLEYETALKTPPWTDVVPAFVRMAEAMAYSAELRANDLEDKGWQPGRIPPLPEDYWHKVENWGLVYHTLLTACTNCLARHPTESFPVSTWRRDLAMLGPLPSEVSAFLDVLEGHPPDGSLFQQAGAGLVVLHAGPVSLDTLWRALFRFLNAFGRLSRWASDDTEVLATSRWLQALNEQRFAFSPPSLAVPAIRASCDDGTLKGFPKVASILLAAAPYLSSIRIMPDARAMLESIVAGGTGHSPK